MTMSFKAFAKSAAVSRSALADRNLGAVKTRVTTIPDDSSTCRDDAQGPERLDLSD